MIKHVITFVFLLSTFTSVSLAADTPVFPFVKGEMIDYDIKKFGITGGHAKLTYKGSVIIEGQELLEVNFQASGFGFQNEEQIYFNPKTFFPVLVKRKLRFFGTDEVAEERYDSLKKEVVVKRIINGEESTLVIKKEHVLDNIYCFIFRYRNSGKFDIGEKSDLYLPTRDVSITLLEEDKIKVAGEKVKSYYVESSSKQCCNIWFDQSEQRIPVRIDGVVGLARVSMVMSSYTKE